LQERDNCRKSSRSTRRRRKTKTKTKTTIRTTVGRGAVQRPRVSLVLMTWAVPDPECLKTHGRRYAKQSLFITLHAEIPIYL
jgi:hypothetical protein